MSSQQNQSDSPLKLAAAELNHRVDCADLALRLGLPRDGTKGNFENPNDKGRPKTLACYADSAGGKGSKWKDFRTEDHGGPIDLLMLVQGLEFASAVRELAQMYGMTIGTRARPVVQAPKSTAEFIADNCLRDGRGPRSQEVIDYLAGRGIEPFAIEAALKKGTLGLNLWTSPKVARGEVNWGGAAAAFVVRSQQSGQVVAVDMRYFNPEDNGGVKTQSQGEKAKYPWCSDWRALEAAKTVYVVESSINVLSIESCRLPGCAAISLRGTGNVETIDWAFLRGKQVIGCMDNDLPFETGPHAGYCAGLKAFWRLHEILTGLDISCLMVDQADWKDDDDKPINDVNDLLQARGPDDTAKALRKLQDWLIPGMVGNDERWGKPRLFLPHHDYLVYWKYRVQGDFTKVIGKTTKDEETGTEKHDYGDVCGFRVAAVSRVKIASPTSTMTGEADSSPRTVFAVSVQTARHGPVLQRRVLEDEQLHNLETWKKFGNIMAPLPFGRMLNIFERAVNIGARHAVNFVGLAWRDGQPVVNEGLDCFFQDPKKQCPYADLAFPAGVPANGKTVLLAYGSTFKNNAALIPLVWALGAHLKAFLGFWPHFVLQAEKSSGKSTLLKRMERSIAMSMFSGQSLETAFRMLTSISYTSHPVGWEEISARKQELIDRAVSNLQECYQYTHTRRGAELTDFLLCAPVMLAGEDVPVKSLIGKVVKSTLTTKRQGDQMPEDLVQFPVRNWLQYLAETGKGPVRELFNQQLAYVEANCSAKLSDAGAKRMLSNYAAVATAWALLCDFTGLDADTGNFTGDLIVEMNAHIMDSASDRQPWVWITEKLLSEISANNFRYPFRFDEENGVPVLCVRTGHVMDHMSQSPALRDFWNQLPVKSDRVYKKALESQGILEAENIERTVHGRRVGYMVAMSIPALEKFGLYAVMPKPESY